MASSDVAFLQDGLARLLDGCRATGATDAGSTVEISETQTRILRQLDGEDPTMVGELADHFGVTLSTMSLNLKRLEEAGCIRRSRDPEDRRVMNVRLTDTGMRVKAQSSPLDAAKIDVLLQTLRPEERRRAVAGFRILLEGMGRVGSRSDEYLRALTGEESETGGGEDR